MRDLHRETFCMMRDQLELSSKIIYTTSMRDHRKDRRRRTLRFYFARLSAFLNSPLTWK